MKVAPTETPAELQALIEQVIRRNYSQAFLFKLLTKAGCLEMAMYEKQRKEAQKFSL